MTFLGYLSVYEPLDAKVIQNEIIDFYILGRDI